MEKKLDIIKKLKEVKKKKKLNSNNKGFSLIELLIVIAIMGVLAVIAFNMFGGVLLNSKKRADEQQARNVEKALLTYCVDSGDWYLGQIQTPTTTGGTTTFAEAEVRDGDTEALIEIMMKEIKNSVDGRSYGPLLSLKDPSLGADNDVNVNAYKPQWSVENGGEYIGWKVTLFPSKQSVKVEPVTDDDEEGAIVKLDANETEPST